jgi:hypothetical protein
MTTLVNIVVLDVGVGAKYPQYGEGAPGGLLLSLSLSNIYKSYMICMIFF